MRRDEAMKLWKRALAAWIALILIGRDWLIFTLMAALLVAMRPWRKAI